MSEVFISYSRKDSEFVQRLTTAFVGANRVVWIDWQDIPRGEEWWHTIERGIEEAENLICVISEHWLTSKICHQELLHARRQNKRVLPIIRQQIEGNSLVRIEQMWNSADWQAIPALDNWSFIKARNWIFFDSDEISRFLSEFNALLKALEEDQPHIKAHTRLQSNALDWQRSERNPSFLLAGDQLTFAEKWLEASTGKQPEPTPLQHEFTTASRTEENARQRRIRQLRQATIGLGIVGIAAAIVAVLMFGQANSANQQREVAIVARGQAETAQAVFATREASANEQIATATISLSTATAVAQQVENATATLGAVNEQLKDTKAQALLLGTEVAIAGATLTPVPPTLTAVAIRQDIAFRFGNAILDLSTFNNPQVGQFVAQQVVADYPDNALAYQVSGMLNSNTGNWKQAIDDFNRAVEIEPEAAMLYNSRGSVYLAQQQWDNAINDFTHAIELDPQLVRAYYNRGVALYGQGNLDDAVDEYTRVIEMNPEFANAYYNRAIIYYEQGRIEEAIADYTRIIEIDPKSVLHYINRGRIYYEQGRFEEAIADYNQALEIESQVAIPYNNRGLVYVALGRLEEAITDYDRAIEIDPLYANAYLNRGYAYVLLAYKQSSPALFDTAISDFNRTIEIDPQDAQAYYNRGSLYNLQGKITEAIADFTHAIEINAQYADAYTNRGVTYGHAGKIQEAIEDFTRAIELDPQQVNAFGSRGLIYYNSGNFEAALSDWQEYEHLGGPFTPEEAATYAALQATITPMPTWSVTPDS